MLLTHIVVRLMAKLFKLIGEGHVKPISPIHRFPFDDAPSAIRLLRAGKHIGKIVLSNGVNPRLMVPVSTNLLKPTSFSYVLIPVVQSNNKIGPTGA